MAQFTSLTDWLDYQAQLHPIAMDFGLDRVRDVANRLGLLSPKSKVVTVAGTNGKGSSTAMLSAIYTQAGYTTGWYSSPHIWRYNERIRINNHPVTDEQLIFAFSTIEQARGEVSITVFEWGVLAALWLFAQANCDVIILEVGLGGRLDAVNIIDADISLITAIDVDHAAYLGNSREVIAPEKAGIMREGRPAIVSDPNPPTSLINTAQRIGVSSLQLLGKDYHYQRASDASWQWSNHVDTLTLSNPLLQGDFQFNNAAGSVAVVQSLQAVLPVSQTQLSSGLTKTTLSGRLQTVMHEGHAWLLDIAHNPQSIQSLVTYLKTETRPVYLVFSALEDKDIVQMMQMLEPIVSQWWIAPLNAPRAADLSRLKRSAMSAGLTEISWCDNINDACTSAQFSAEEKDVLLLACGSFLTIEQVGCWLGVAHG